MEHQFWHQCWEKDHIGFHQDGFHPLMEQYFPAWRGGEDRGVFVPLCGKSLDMHYIGRNNPVLGAELSEKACRDFFVEAGIRYGLTEDSRYQRLTGANIQLLAGDFFALTSQDLTQYPLIYDRAALIALPQAMRETYVAHLRSLYPNGGKLFLLTLEYPLAELVGPPFAVHQDEVEHLFGGCSIAKMATLDLPDGKFARRTFKVSQMREVLYFIDICPNST